MIQTQRPSAVVIDGSSSMRQAIPLLHRGIDWVASSRSVEEVLALRPEADLVVVDVHLRVGQAPAMLRATAIRALVRAGYSVVVHSLESRPLVLASLVRGGALGVVHKADSSHDFDAVVARVMLGQRAWSASVAFIEDELPSYPVLTSRQWQVLLGRLNGLSWRQLSRQLFITESVAREHMSALTSKLEPHATGRTPAELAWVLGLRPGDTYEALEGNRRRLMGAASRAA